MRRLAQRRVLRTISRAATAPSVATAWRRAATAPVPSPAWAAARSYGATACRPHAASGAAGLWSLWSRLTGSGQAQQTQGSGEAQQTQESYARSTDKRHVVSTEVPAAGVGLNDRNLEILHMPEHELGERHAGELQRLMKAGELAAAHVLMDKLKDNGTADTWHFNIMLRACEDSTEMRHVIGTEMPAARVEPNVVTFNTLVSRLIIEGDAAGARRVVEEEMPAAGVQPDDRTFETLHMPKHKLGKMRTGELQRLLKLGNVGAACALMDKLVKLGAVNGKHRAIIISYIP